MSLGKGVLAALLGALLCSATASAAYPGLNGKIAWERYDADHFDIWIANGDGSSPVNLTADLEPSASSPSFSADGRRLVFDAGGNLATMNADGSNRVVSSIDIAARAVFTPDGQQIIFGRDTGAGAYKTFIVPAGLNAVPNELPTGGTPTSQEFEAAISPDGARLAWTSNRGSAVQLFLGNGNATAGVQFTSTAPGTFPRGPDFSPDGTQLLWAQRDAGVPKLLRAPVAPVGVTPTVVPVPAPDAFPSHPAVFSPDGTRVAYTSTGQGGDDDIATAKLDGSEVANISDGGVSNVLDDQSPTWAVAVDVPRLVTATFKKRKTRFVGALTAAGDPGCVPNAPIVVERSKRGKLKQVATGQTDASGAYAIKLKRAKPGKYFVSSPADPREGVANCLEAAPVKVTVKGKRR